jgi:hypothetical protein
VPGFPPDDELGKREQPVLVSEGVDPLVNNLHNVNGRIFETHDLRGIFSLPSDMISISASLEQKAA